MICAAIFVGLGIVGFVSLCIWIRRCEPKPKPSTDDGLDVMGERITRYIPPARNDHEAIAPPVPSQPPPHHAESDHGPRPGIQPPTMPPPPAHVAPAIHIPVHLHPVVHPHEFVSAKNRKIAKSQRRHRGKKGKS